MLADLRTAARSLRRAPGLVAAAVLTIALGAAANATAFAWFKGVALDPLPHVRDARGLVHVQTLGRRSGDRSGLSYPDYRDWRAQARSVTGLAAYAFERFGVRTAPPAGPGATEVVWGNYATADYFTTLGARPALGRFWRPDEASTAGGAPVAVLSDALWRRRFGADPGAVGRTVWVNGVACTVIGVAPRDFAGAFVGMAFDLWVPVTMYPRLADWKEKLDRRESFWLYAFARPRPGLALGEVNAELRAVAARVAAAEPSARDHVPLAAAFDEGQAQQMMRPLFGLLVGAALLVQLVVCANVGNLLLARAAARERELGVRAALGAGRRRLVGELAAEGALLAAAGGALGTFAAAFARPLLAAALPAMELPLRLNAGVDWRVLAAGAGLALGTALLAGVVPALRATRAGRRGTASPDALARALVTGGRAATRTSGGALRTLVVAQLALSLVALVGAGLFARSRAALGRVDLGFRSPERVLVAFTDLALAGRTADDAGRALVERWAERVRALPGVEAAAVSDFVPLGFGYNTNAFVPTGYVARPGESVSFQFNAVGDDYFRTLGVRLARGRVFGPADAAGAPRVAVVNEAYARRFFPGPDPLGAAVGATAGYGADGAGSDVRIVGVVADGRYGMRDLARGPVPFVYTPFAQRPSSSVFVQVRARPGVDPLALAPAVGRALAAADPALPLIHPVTLERWSRAASFAQRLGAAALAGLGLVALLLAAVGLYAVTAYAVARRTREIGVRVALGATARRVAVAILGDGGRTVAAGVAVGAALAIGAARLLRGQLYGVSPADPATFAGAAAVLALVALVATWLPARRASHVAPTEALRAE